MAYRLHLSHLYYCHLYYRETGGCEGFALEDEFGKSFFGTRDRFKKFRSASAAWAWLGVNPRNLPPDELVLVEEEGGDVKYTRSYRRVRRGVIVTDTPEEEGQIVSRRYSLQRVL